MEKVDTISEVKTKDLPGGVTLYLLFDSDGREYSTRNRDLARVGHAAQAAGQHVHLDYDEKKGGQYGQFTNRYLNSIKPLSGDEQLAAVQSVADPFAKDPFEDAIPDPPQQSAPSEKDLNIAKAVGLKAGVEVLQYLPPEERTVSNVVTAAEYFTRWLQTWRP